MHVCMCEMCLIMQGIIGVLRTANLLLVGLACCSVLIATAGGVDGVFNIEDYGALGDGTTDDTKVRTRPLSVENTGVYLMAGCVLTICTVCEGVRGRMGGGVRRHWLVVDAARAGGKVIPRRPHQV